MTKGESTLKSRLLGIAATALFLWLAFYNVNLAELAHALQRVNYTLIAPAAAVTLLGYVLRTLRWRVILTRASAPHFGALFAILMMGFATNNLLPARLGELARAYLLGRQTGQRKTQTLATILVERVFDGLVLIALLGAVSALPIVSLPGWGQDVQRFSSVLFLAAAAAILLILSKQPLAERLLRLLVRPLPARLGAWIEAAFDAFVKGLRSVRRPRVLLATLALSLAIWSLEAISYYTLISALDLPLAGLSGLAASLLVLVIINLGIMLPSAPGYIGTYQFFAVSALAVFQVPREPSLALAIVSHVMQYVLVTAIGLYYLSRFNLSLGRLVKPPAETAAVDRA